MTNRDGLERLIDKAAKMLEAGDPAVGIYAKDEDVNAYMTSLQSKSDRKKAKKAAKLRKAGKRIPLELIGRPFDPNREPDPWLTEREVEFLGKKLGLPIIWT